MKKLKIFLLLFLSAFVNVNACGYDPDPIIRESLKGKIKTITQTAYPAVEVDGEILRGRVRMGGYDESRLYNEDGCIVEKITPSHYWWFGGEQIIYRYIYDKNNNLIEERYFTNDTTYRATYYSYEYNDKGLVLKKTKKAESGNLEEIKLFEYDEKGNLKEEILTYYYGVEICIYYQYDENGKKTMAISERETTEFDENGNEIRVTRNWLPTDIITTYQYEYDETGNWIKKIKFADNPKEPDMIVREITYYE